MQRTSHGEAAPGLSATLLDSGAVPRSPLLPLEETTSRLERVLAGSPADRTEIAWIELRHGRESAPLQSREEAAEQVERTVVVRVWERGRTGSHRTGVGTVSELAAAVREALGAARLAPPPGYPPPPFPMPSATGVAVPPEALCDPAVAALDPAAARELLRGWTERGEAARLEWVEAQIALAGSDGRRSALRATAASLDVRGRGAASAAGASRTLDGLDAAAIVDRARRREAPAESGGAAPGAPCPLLLAPEAAAALVGLLNRTALTSASYRDGSSPLCGNLGAALFDPAITLCDDATDLRGLPFPWDLAGAPKRPVELIRDGVAISPAVDEPLAAALGRAATPHAISPDEALATNLFLRPGARSDDDLLREVGEAGGLWVGSLGGIELFDPAGRRFRARAGGVRRITAGGLLGEALPDLFWEDRLPEALSRVLGVGDLPVVVGAGEPLLLALGGTSAPALALDLAGRQSALYPRS